jgi:cysteine-rich repeat protein
MNVMGKSRWVLLSSVAALSLATTACIVESNDGSGGSSTGGGDVGGAASGGGDVGGSGGGTPLVEIPLSGSDSCVGLVPVVLHPGEVGIASGTTIGAKDDMKTFCADVDATTAAPDLVFAVTLPEACTMRLSVSGMDLLDPVLELRKTSCEAESGGDPCINRSDLMNEYHDEALEPGTYYVVVDGANGSEGAFMLRAECQVPTCGDGVVNAGEVCDYGGAAAGDGCADPGSADECQVEAADPALDTCEGATATEAIVIDPTETLYIPADSPYLTTLGATDDATGSCQGELGGRDMIFKVRPSADGTLTAVVGEGFMNEPLCPTDFLGEVPLSCWDRSLYVRTACGDATSELACSDNPTDANAAETVTIPVVAGQDYFVFVDGYNAETAYSAGQFVLRLALQ